MKPVNMEHMREVFYKHLWKHVTPQKARRPSKAPAPNRRKGHGGLYRKQNTKAKRTR